MRQIYIFFSALQIIYALFAKNSYCIHRNITSRCKYLYIDRLAPCTEAKILKVKYFVNTNFICTFEPKIYADKHRPKVDK